VAAASAGNQSAEARPVAAQPTEGGPVIAQPAESLSRPESVAPEPEADEPEAATGQDAAEPEPQDRPEPVPGTAGPAAGDESALVISGQVTVVPGIARYHRSQCILIRFLGSDDLETMTRKAAEDAAFAPCRACQPDKDVADS
jgi:hypothetical protein